MPKTAGEALGRNGDAKFVIAPQGTKYLIGSSEKRDDRRTVGPTDKWRTPTA